MTPKDLNDKLNSQIQHKTKNNVASTGTNKLDLFKRQVEVMIPESMNKEKIVTTIINLVFQNPELTECEHYSLVKSVVQATEMDLDFNLGQAYVVPQNKTIYDKNSGQPFVVKLAQLQIGYKGYISMLSRAGVNAISRVVYSDDIFEFEYGTKEYIKHIPNLEKTGEFFAVYAVYYIPKLNYKSFIILGKKDIEKRIKMNKMKTKNIWENWYDEMAMAKCLKKVASVAPISIKEKIVIEDDDENQDIVDDGDKIKSNKIQIPENNQLLHQQIENKKEDIPEKQSKQKETLLLDDTDNITIDENNNINEELKSNKKQTESYLFSSNPNTSTLKANLNLNKKLDMKLPRGVL